MPEIQAIKYIILALLLTAGLAKAAADAQVHGSPRLARWFPRWAGPQSWRLKYRNGDAAQGPRFWLADTLLVFVSDLWHCMNALSWACADAAFLLAAWPAYRWWAVGAVAARRCVFQPVYSWLRK